MQLTAARLSIDPHTSPPLNASQPAMAKSFSIPPTIAVTPPPKLAKTPEPVMASASLSSSKSR